MLKWSCWQNTPTNIMQFEPMINLKKTNDLEINTIDKQMHVLKAQWPSSEIPCCQISPDQEAKAALLMLLKRILKWLCGVQAMTPIPRSRLTNNPLICGMCPNCLHWFAGWENSRKHIGNKNKPLHLQRGRKIAGGRLNHSHQNRGLSLNS